MNRRKLGLVVAWLAGTTLAMILSTQAVGLVRNQVTDQPSRAVKAFITDAQDSAPPGFTSSAEQGSTTTVATTAPDDTTTTDAGSTTTTVATTPPDDTTTTTVVTTTPTPSSQRYAMEGGWVVVGCNGNRIVFKSAAPANDYHLVRNEVSDSVVDVQFVGEEHLSSFVATCQNGSIAETIAETHVGDGDGDRGDN